MNSKKICIKETSHRVNEIYCCKYERSIEKGRKLLSDILLLVISIDFITSISLFNHMLM